MFPCSEANTRECPTLADTSSRSKRAASSRVGQPEVPPLLDGKRRDELAGSDALRSFRPVGNRGRSGRRTDTNDADDPVARREWLGERRKGGEARAADRFRETLTKWYGAEQGAAVKYAEAFEVCEYGGRPSQEQFRELFPFFPKP